MLKDMLLCGVQLLLEAPDDILCFKFMPTNPAIVAGGCINGQVVLWDISEHLERLKAPRAGKKKASSIFVSRSQPILRVKDLESITYLSRHFTSQ